mgnify:CR=1 FL=1
MNWKNKVILISGGTSGIGLATARILLGKGACVVINGRDTARGEEALAQLGTLAGNCQFVPGDVSRKRHAGIWCRKHWIISAGWTDW